MDPYSEYQEQLEYYEYFEKQRENYTDLTRDLTDVNNSIYLLARELFGKTKNDLSSQLTSILIDESTETIDIFCILLELVLYGLDILTNGQADIFDLKDQTDDIIYKIKSYLKTANFDMSIEEEIVDPNDVALYRDDIRFYCEVVPKPPLYFCAKSWCVLNYRLIINRNFKFTDDTPVTVFKAFFISKDKKVFTINFGFGK